jgi:poly(3-hydroxyalkanoate) synthetase
MNKQERIELDFLTDEMNYHVQSDSAINLNLLKRFKMLKNKNEVWKMNKVKKEAINKSSNLATNLENWEQKMRNLNYAFYSDITKNKLGLNTYIEFNYFNGYSWSNLILE